MPDDYLDARTADALNHIERNGSLAWIDVPTPEVTRLYGDLEAKGYLDRNPWSGQLVLSDEAKAARTRTREIDDLMGFVGRMSRR